MADTEQVTSTMLHDDLVKEYFTIVDLVTSFDQRLLTIKGWGVTLSLASLGLGFQQGHYGLFLVAALSGVAFWLVEATTKLHQMRFYPRMGDIEAAAYALYHVETPDGPVTSPLIDWSWFTAKPRVLGTPQTKSTWVPERWQDVGTRRLHPLLFPHVMLPHVVAVIAGTTLFVIGLCGVLGDI